MGEIFKVESAVQPLAFTGERLTSAACGEIEIDHCHRYFIARDLCRDKRVLDIASGEGYGAALLAQVAQCVIGVEVNTESVSHAKNSYSRHNLHFVQGDARCFPLLDASVDVVVSFETLEHIAEQEAFFLEVKRVLKPNGVLLISTPDRDVYSPVDRPANPFHMRELTRSEFQDSLSEAFSELSVYAQRIFTGSAVVPICRHTPAGRVRSFERRDTNYAEADQGLPRAPILIAFASDQPLGDLFPASLYISKSEVQSSEGPLYEGPHTTVPVQVYPFGTAGYCEDRSIRERILSEEWRTLIFDLPEGGGNGPIRIDPAESLAVIRIGKVAITSRASGAVLWAAETPTDLRSIEVSGSCVLLPYDDAYVLVSYGTDPQIRLPAVESSIYPLRIEVILRVEKTIGAVYEALEIYLRTINEKLQHLRVELTASHAERVIAVAELKRVAIDRSEIHAELSRVTETLQQEGRARKSAESDLYAAKSLIENSLDAEKSARASLDRVQVKVASLEEGLAAERRLRSGLEQSVSWKITKPARAAMRLLRGVLGH